LLQTLKNRISILHIYIHENKRYRTRKIASFILSAAGLASIGLPIATTATIAFAITYSGTNFGEVHLELLPATLYMEGAEMIEFLAWKVTTNCMVIAEMTRLQVDQVEITLTVEPERTLLQTIIGHLEIVKHQTVKGSNRLISHFSFFSRYHYSLSLSERNVISLC
jgi:hypothetical protein